MITEISSLQHPLVKKWCNLRSDKIAREETGLVLLTGEKLIRDLAKKVVLKGLITVDRVNISAEEKYVVSQEILKKVTGLGTPDGFAAIAEMPKASSLVGRKRILMLDRLADPGNLGTLLRSALALDWDGVVFTEGTVDPFNDKALRASQGALFSLPFAWADGADFVTQAGVSVYLADLDGKGLAETRVNEPFVLILSHEGSGPSPWAEEVAQKISIPMHNGVESLNVAASGAIFLYAMGSR